MHVGSVHTAIGMEKSGIDESYHFLYQIRGFEGESGG